jgi:hypothetical protein
MRNKGILTFLIVLTFVIMGVVILDYLSERPDRQPANPYELQMDTLTAVDPSIILYKEVRNLKLDLEQPRGISLIGEKLLVAGDKKLIICDVSGRLLKEILLETEPLCLKATPETIYVGSAKQVSVLDTTGKITSKWDTFYENSVLTSIDVFDKKVFIADAGKRRVYRFSDSGVKEVEFEGKVGEGDTHGFIIPSPNFDLAIDRLGDLWVANPGKHALENYTFDGKPKGWWDAMTSDIKGFSGCCNPANFTFLPNGNFITSEKGIVRIKEYKPSGEFVGVVAEPSRFEEEQHAPDVVTDDLGRIYVLDKERKMMRVFEKK